MASLEILIQGYASHRNDWIKASSTVCLIRTSDGKLILSDPGCNRPLLLKALAERGLATGDIHFIFHTHSHYDHIALSALFENAQIISYDSSLLFREDEMKPFPLDFLSSEIEIILTPGHCEHHQSLLIQTPEGMVCIAGDVFWFWDDETELAESAGNSESVWSFDTLQKSRRDIFMRAYLIIPGHGPSFLSASLSSAS